MNKTFAEINLKNLVFNYNSIRRKTKTKIMAVVKADAYGHGMLEVVDKLSKLENSPEYYGVALLNEAIELRKSKLTNKPILCFAPFDFDQIDSYLKHNIIPTICTTKQVSKLSGLHLKKKLKVHFNINTGMNRLGIKSTEAISNIKKLLSNDKIIIDGIYTHFATSDEKNKQFANTQLDKFCKVIEELKRLKINYGLAHCANSGAILDMPNSYFDMVRPGISLYGYYPSLETTESIKLKPVMSIYSEISTISDLDPGDSVGYGRKFITKQKTKCATLPIGYADGLLRGLSNRIKVIISDRLYSQIGRVSMDRISIEIGNSNIREGQKVILMGKSKSYNIDAWDWAKVLDTIPYEITCSISKRVPRKFK